MSSSPSNRDGDKGIEEARELLSRLYGEGSFPLAMAGDLDDLRFTLENIIRLLKGLVRDRASLGQDELERNFHDLEILLEQELPYILEDLLPSMKEMRRRGRSS